MCACWLWVTAMFSAALGTRPSGCAPVLTHACWPRRIIAVHIRMSSNALLQMFWLDRAPSREYAMLSAREPVALSELAIASRVVGAVAGLEPGHPGVQQDSGRSPGGRTGAGGRQWTPGQRLLRYHCESVWTLALAGTLLHHSHTVHSCQMQPVCSESSWASRRTSADFIDAAMREWQR